MNEYVYVVVSRDTGYFWAAFSTREAAEDFSDGKFLVRQVLLCS